jgi:hypothetical protein
MTMTTLDTEGTKAPTSRQMTLPELRKFDGQLYIANNTPHKITFHERLGDKWVDFELDPAGEPDSIAFLPKLALDMRGLQKLWMKGAVSISEDPELENQIMLLNARSVGASEARLAEIMGKTTENANHRDITEALCLVCGSRNREGVIERGRVMLSRRQVKDGTAPLCSEHLSESHRYVPRLVSNASGEEHWEFDSVSMSATRH